MQEVDVRQWLLLGDGTELLDRGQATLQNRQISRSIRYGEREYGINLVWDTAVNLSNTLWRKAQSSDSVIRFGDHLAVHVSGDGFLRYADREYGINLVWSQNPVYEWEILGGAIGDPVQLNARVGLFNRTHGDYVVYGERDYGINLRWWGDLDIYGDYPPLPIPPELRGQSFEPGQIVLGGTVSEIELFHGGTDNELDWHIYIHLNPTIRQRLLDHLLAQTTGAQSAHGSDFGGALPLTGSDLDPIYCEWMVTDGYSSSAFDERWFSADLTKILMLDRSSWDISVEAGELQNIEGASVYVGNESALVRRSAPVLLQGAFVNDTAHGFRIEIHPLDSLAYALNEAGMPLSATPAEVDIWPARELTWRVAAFTNSTDHRIDDADYLKKVRTSTWYLRLPREAAQPRSVVTVTAEYPQLTNDARGRGGVDDIRQTDHNHYNGYGLQAESYGIEQDARTGERRLRVTISMHPPDRWGGMFLAEYNVKVSSELLASP